MTVLKVKVATARNKWGVRDALIGRSLAMSRAPATLHRFYQHNHIGINSITVCSEEIQQELVQQQLTECRGPQQERLRRRASTSRRYVPSMCKHTVFIVSDPCSYAFFPTALKYIELLQDY
jgi:hypothetical protein